MKSLIRGFLYGVGFVAGATITGTLIGYGVGKVGELGLKAYSRNLADGIEEYTRAAAQEEK